MRETPEDLKALGITYRLTDYKALMKEAERLALELDDARNAAPKSPQITGMPHSGNQTTLDLQMEIIEAAEKRFFAARDRALTRLEEIEDKIDSLDDPQLRRVLYFRHVYRLNWYEVAEKMHYSKSSVQRFHRQALKELEGKDGKGII